MKRDSWSLRPRSNRIMIGLAPARISRAHRDGRPRRYVMQTHALSAPRASSRSLFIAGLIAVALYFVGRKFGRRSNR